MKDLHFRRVRGLVIGMLFVLMGFTLYENPDAGTATYLKLVYSIEFLSAFFVVSGVMVAYGGWRNREHNALWYTPIFAYTLGVYVHASESGIPLFTVLVYTMLSAMFILEIGKDISGG